MKKNCYLIVVFMFLVVLHTSFSIAGSPGAAGIIDYQDQEGSGPLSSNTHNIGVERLFREEVSVPFTLYARYGKEQGYLKLAELEKDTGYEYSEEADEYMEGIADPLEPVNRLIFRFNDKLYFWVLKPVASGYKEIMPEQARIGVKKFFSNLKFPVRFVNCMLQAKFEGVGYELGRFLINSTMGLAGFLMWQRKILTWKNMTKISVRP